MADLIVPPGGTVGILGGGQLGRMLAMAAAKLGLRCHIYCDEERAPAYDVAAEVTVAAYDNAEALEKFGRSVDVATVEFENVPASALEIIQRTTAVYPPARSLEVSQDRLQEKTFAQELGVAVAPYRPVSSLDELEMAVKELGAPGLLKTRRFGYDGKGQVRIMEESDLRAAFDSLDGAPALLERFVDFECEVSMVAARGRDGSISCYDLAENDHSNQILSQTRIPARVPASIADSARRWTEEIMASLDYCGVLCVEFFYCGEKTDAPLVMNEFAPRVHNSGHWTLDACAVSQFENHIRAVAGWPLGECSRKCDAVMTNLIGEDVGRWRDIAEEPNVSLHLYGKREARKGRKMGHYTQLYPKENGTS